MLITPNLESITTQKHNEKIGLVINTPNQSVSLQDLSQIYSDASSTGIERSNVYLFWNVIEPIRGEFDWKQSDVLMSLNKKNDLKVTLYFSVINGETLGPFPNWIGKPSLNAIGEDRLVNVLDAVLSASITADRTSSRFTIEWSDGHTSLYSFSLLRHACPCAECRGGHAFMTGVPDQQFFTMPEEDTPATHIRNVEAVGSYAWTIAWEDGHTYGIYTWNYLRALCPCEQCRG